MDSREAATSRFSRREPTAAESVAGWPDWHAEVSGIVAASGGAALLEQMYDDLRAVLRQRPGVMIVSSVAGDAEATYDAVVRALEGDG